MLFGPSTPDRSGLDSFVLDELAKAKEATKSGSKAQEVEFVSKLLKIMMQAEGLSTQKQCVEENENFTQIHQNTYAVSIFPLIPLVPSSII